MDKFKVSLSILVLGLGVIPARAQMPGGIPLPTPIDKPGSIHGDSRIDYYLASSSYRYQGQYSFTYGITKIGPTPLYFFASVDVEILSDEVKGFQPDRFAGTFELGSEHLAGIAPLGLALRHQSPHDIDRSDRRQGSWEAIEARWDKTYGGSQVILSAGPYVHTIVNDYRWDLDAQFRRPLGRLRGHPISLDADLHHIVEAGARGGITDYWVEGRAGVSTHSELFAGVGQLHDMDVFDGKTDTPVVAGIRFFW